MPSFSPSRLRVKRTLKRNQQGRLANQAVGSDDQIEALTRSRAAALHEAAYYRAKLAAFESAAAAAAGNSNGGGGGGGVDAVAKVERERASELERRLADTLADRHALEAKLAKLEHEVEHHSTMRGSIEERHQAAISRAETAESAHARAVADLAEVEALARTHEQTISDHVAKLGQLSSRHDLASSERDEFKERAIEHERSVERHALALEQVQVALVAAHARNDELNQSWDRATTEATEHRQTLSRLERELEEVRGDHATATARCDELERILKSTKDEHDATRIVATGSLAEILDAHKKKKRTRSIKPNAGDREVDANGDDEDEEEEDEDESSPHALRLRAVEEELGSVKQVHADTRTRADALATELGEARTREARLHAEVASLRHQVSTLQSRHAAALDDVARHESLAKEREAATLEHARTRRAGEVKVGILRNLMADHGIAVTEDDLATTTTTTLPPMSGNESAEQLYERVNELESLLEQKTKAHRDLDSTHQDARRELDDLTRQRDEHADELRKLRDANEAASSPEDQERLARVQGELETLQQRHSQLEQTHLKAVQYVKGTEKMLRRMKEELTRYKERCDELDSPERQRELEQLRADVDRHRSDHDATTREFDEHRRTAVAVQSEFERTLSEQRLEAETKIKQLNDELSKLDDELEKAHADLEETHAVNASLNKLSSSLSRRVSQKKISKFLRYSPCLPRELQTALKNPTSPRLGSHAASEDVTRLQADLQQ